MRGAFFAAIAWWISSCGFSTGANLRSQAASAKAVIVVVAKEGMFAVVATLEEGRRVREIGGYVCVVLKIEGRAHGATAEPRYVRVSVHHSNPTPRDPSALLPVVGTPPPRVSQLVVSEVQSAHAQLKSASRRPP